MTCVQEGDEDAFVGFDPTDIGKERVSLCEQLFQKTVGAGVSLQQ